LSGARRVHTAAPARRTPSAGLHSRVLAGCTARARSNL